MYPVLYYLISAILLALLISQCTIHNSHRRTVNPTKSDGIFLSLSLVLLIFMRLPTVFYNREFDPDESQLLTQAITLWQDPIYGRSVDGTSIGPINTYLLLIPHAFGLPFDYTSGRLMGLLLVIGSLFLFYRSLILITTPIISRLSFLPILLFFASTTDISYVPYGSELSSLLLITVCFYLTIRLLHSLSWSLISLLFLGALAGLTPYAKLQGLPVVGMILIIATLYLFQQRRWGWQAIYSFTALSVGFILPSMILLSVAYRFGVHRYFIDYYFIGNLTTYGQIYAHVPLVNQGLVAKLIHFPFFLSQHFDFLILIVANCLISLGIALIIKRLGWKVLTVPSWTLSLVVLTTAGAIYATVAPGTEFGHHLLMLVFPLGWAMALSLERIMNHTKNDIIWRQLVKAVIAIIILEFLLTDNLLLSYVSRESMMLVKTKLNSSKQPGLVERHDQEKILNHWLLSRNPSLFSFPDSTSLPCSPVSRAINQYARRGDKMAVWGWNCQYYVETGLAQGVSENHTQRSVIPNVMRDQYLNRYARELSVNRPSLFVDAVGNYSWMLTKQDQRHEYFPVINRVVQTNYTLVRLVNNVRIYVLRDRLKKA